MWGFLTSTVKLSFVKIWKETKISSASNWGELTFGFGIFVQNILRIVGWITVYLGFLDPNINWYFLLDILFVYCLAWWLISIIVDSHKCILTLIVESLFIVEWCMHYWDNQTLSLYSFMTGKCIIWINVRTIYVSKRKNSGYKKNPL